MGKHSSLAPLAVCTVAVVAIIWAILVLAIRLYLRFELNVPANHETRLV